MRIELRAERGWGRWRRATGSIVSRTSLSRAPAHGPRCWPWHQLFESADVVRAGMEFEIGKQLAFWLREFFGPREKFDAEARGGGARGIALGRDVLGFDEAFLFASDRKIGTALGIFCLSVAAVSERASSIRRTVLAGSSSGSQTNATDARRRVLFL